MVAKVAIIAKLATFVGRKKQKARLMGVAPWFLIILKWCVTSLPRIQRRQRGRRLRLRGPAGRRG